MAFEIGILCYDLGFFQEALGYFTASENTMSLKPDIYYNRALCYYQLRMDKQFISEVKKGKNVFPAFQGFTQLQQLDLSAK